MQEQLQRVCEPEENMVWVICWKESGRALADGDSFI